MTANSTNREHTTAYNSPNNSVFKTLIFNFLNAKNLPYFIGLCFLVVIVQISYHTVRSDFFQLIGLYTVLFFLYWWAYRHGSTSQKLYFFIGIAIFARLLLVFAMPNLSDDVFRFVWDGRLWHAGINPFDALPSDYAQNGFPNGLDHLLYQRLNSPNYFTIYPPVAQLTFYIATFTNDIWWSSVLMKVVLFIADLGTIWLLFQLLPERKKVLLYALNPLIILEIMGNLHFEGVMIFFLLAAFYALKKHLYTLSAVAFSLSIASKLLPLMFLPFLIYKIGWLKSLRYFAIVGGVSMALFYPLLGQFFITNFGNSLNLYFQKFEFNASIYYVLRWLGFQISGYNLIHLLGPFLAIVVGIFILKKAFSIKNPTVEELPQLWLWAITLYLFSTTTVHPWYTALPIVLCLFTNFRFPILWSFLIFFTYINYSYPTYFENLWIVGIEYLLVFVFLKRETLIDS